MKRARPKYTAEHSSCLNVAYWLTEEETCGGKQFVSGQIASNKPLLSSPHWRCQVGKVYFPNGLASPGFSQSHQWLCLFKAIRWLLTKFNGHSVETGSHASNRPAWHRWVLSAESVASVALYRLFYYLSVATVALQSGRSLLLP